MVSGLDVSPAFSIVFGPFELIVPLSTCSTCENGQWKCTKKDCSATCTVLGGSRFSTYDGKTYSYHGDCTYVLSKVRPLSEGTL